MRIENIRTTGWGLDNNVWMVANNERVILIDAPHDAEAILNHIGKRKLEAILFTHAHPDHVNAAKELVDSTTAPTYLHPADKFMWEQFNKDFYPDHELADAQTLKFDGAELTVIHTPGHTPGGVCFYWEAGKTLFSGDTLFPGGPGATKWEYSSFTDIIDSIANKLLPLPGDTKVLAGHGKPTTIGQEADSLDEWVKRGY